MNLRVTFVLICFDMWKILQNKKTFLNQRKIPELDGIAGPIWNLNHPNSYTEMHQNRSNRLGGPPYNNFGFSLFFYFSRLTFKFTAPLFDANPTKKFSYKSDDNQPIKKYRPIHIKFVLVSARLSNSNTFRWESHFWHLDGNVAW